MPRSFPQEILDLIIDYLHNEPQALKTCCLVSKAWVYRAQKCLFYHVQFRRHHHVSRWRRSFPDPLNSPARNTQTLSIGLAELVTVVDVDTLRVFRGVSRLNVDTTRWHGPPFSLLPLHGLFPTIRSLRLSFSSFQSSKIFPFVCSFPLLENLALAGRIGNNRDVVWNVPQTSPNLIGSLELCVGAGVEHLVRQLLDLPKGLRPKSIAVRWSVPEAVGSTMDLVLGCSDTLESLKITNHLKYLPGTSLDLSKAKKLKNIEFLCKEPDVTWITAALRTMEFNNLQSISLVLFPHSDLGASVSALFHQGWVALDQLLVQLWTLHSVRLKFMCEWMNRGWNPKGDAERLFSESMGRQIIDLVEYSPYSSH